MNSPCLSGGFVSVQPGVSDAHTSQRPGCRKHDVAHDGNANPPLPIHFPVPTSNETPPINRMPVEIMAEIFTQFLQLGEIVKEPNTYLLSVSPGQLTSPMVLGQVCGYWRSVALSTPYFWSSISVSSPVRGVIPRIRLWLERASQHPLKLFVSQSAEPDMDEQAVTDEVFSLLLEHYHHWKHITFRIFGGVLKSLVNIQPDPPPLLESAYLDLWWGGNDKAKVDGIWRILHSSPKLIRVDWKTAYLHVRHLPMHIPWNQLKAVTLSHSFDTNTFCTLLKQCSRLEWLQVRSISQHCSLSAPSTPIICLHLRHLSIYAKTSLRAIFDRLLTPALELISLEYNLAKEESRGAYEFGDLLRRSSCSLKSFILRDRHGVDFLDFLLHSRPHMESLEVFHIQTTIPLEAVAALTLTSTNEVQFLPQLQRLKLLSCSSPEGIAEMLSSRLQPHVGSSEMVKALRSVWVGIKADSIPSELAAFQSVSRDDVQIELCYNTRYL